MKRTMKTMIPFLIMIIAVCSLAFAACGGDGEKDSGGIKTYTMEAEYINLEGLKGEGMSNSQYGVDLITGSGSEADIAKGWSNGYFLAHTYVAGLKFDFVFEADKAASSVAIVLRLGSELDTIVLNSSNFAVKLNDVPIEYDNCAVLGSRFEDMSFSNKTITTNAELVKGTNTISLVVLENDLKFGTTGGPMIDNIQIKSSAKLTWTDKVDNPSKRGSI